jgi:beta-aspartyl-peptidase (threonine type)
MMKVSANWSLIIHGGAVQAERPMPAENEAASRAGLAAALETGAAILRQGGSALDAVQAAVRAMEDDPLFNAGRGSVFAADGSLELDAAIMDGASLKAGAVAGVSTIRNPVDAARAVMDRSRHVLLIGRGAEAFAKAQGLAQADTAFFFVERRWRDLERLLARRGQPIPPRPPGAPAPSGEAEDVGPPAHRFGTVGAVARDAGGHLAAATSTGGQTGKSPGRVGDTPIIGAGTYACDGVCAVSGTGTGEYFIRMALAHEIAALVHHAGAPLRAAVDQVVGVDLAARGGDGGVIAIGPEGLPALAFNTNCMLRAQISEGGAPAVALWSDEAL